MQSPATQTEMLDDVEDLYRFLYISHLRFLCDDQVNVHVGMNEVTVSTPTHRSLDSHQAVFLDGHASLQPTQFNSRVLFGLNCTYIHIYYF